MKKGEKIPKEVIIKYIKKDSKIRLFVAFIYMPLIIGIGIFLIMFKETIGQGIITIITSPIALCFGYIIPIKDNNKRIEELEKNDWLIY